MTKKLIEIRKNRYINIDINQKDAEKPTIFLFHGLGGRGEQWDYFKEKLDPHANVIVPDFLGHGDSKKPKNLEFYDFEEMYKDIEELFRQFSGNKNYIIAHSMAATWTCKLAISNPSRIDKLVLITPMACEPRKFIPHIYYLPSWFLGLIQTKLGENFYKLVFTENSDPEIVKKEIEASKKSSMQVIKGMIYSTKDIPSIHVEKIKIKTLLITAEKDKIIPQEESINFYRVLPKVEMTEIKEVGHLPFLEKPEIVYQSIKEFLFQ